MDRKPDLPSTEEQAEMAEFEQLASLLLGGGLGLPSSNAAKQPASPEAENPESSDPHIAFLTRKCQSLEARLSLLEESVGRLCTMLGKLEQEFQIHKNGTSRS